MTVHRIAYFVSPHGFGHAARAAAVMESLHAIAPAICFEIFTAVPPWFFQDSISAEFGYHRLVTDVGLAQESALREDMGATLQRLAELYPFRTAHVDEVARQVTDMGCEGVVCDIAPLGIAVARAAHLPSILVENFTWDWIYAGYLDLEPRLADYIAYLRDAFAGADYHVQTEPVCDYRRAHLVTPPVSRRPRNPAPVIRERLDISAAGPAVLVTMGGIPERHAFLHALTKVDGIYFLIPGAVESAERIGNVILLPHRSDYYHPDLLNACDAVVGKSGYSTVAETYYAGIPFGYISRARFREAARVAGFIEREMSGFEIGETEFAEGAWLSRLPELLTMPRKVRNGANGSLEVATFIRDRLMAR